MTWSVSMKSVLQKILFLAVLLASQAAVQASVLKDHPGRWLGDLKVPGGPTLRLGAELFTRADGSAWASVASPDQDAYDIPVTDIQGNGDTIELKLSFAALKLTWAQDHFKGEWKQGPVPLPLELKPVAQFPMKVRPQTPKAPFPYRNETLAIQSVDGVTLGATLSLPKGISHPNVVVLVAGSGPSTRDENLLGHKSFAVLADYLARRGVAVLRYDKRGISRSTGDYEHHTVVQLVADLNAVIRTLKSRKGLNRLGLIGHSEGSQIAAAAAARRRESVDFVVSMAGVGLPGLDMMLLQDRIWAKDHGADDAEADQVMSYVRKYYGVVLAEAEPGARIAGLKALYNGLGPADKALVEKLEMNVGTLSLPWAEKPFVRASLQADPSTDWRAVRCPVLVLNGGLDHQVPAEENLRGIVAALHAGGNRKVESEMLPSLNHLFQTGATGREDEYGSIDETLAPTVLRRIARFVSKQR
jgi:pimeloyl-ACP methyl ester carboxylesterase